MQRTLLLGACLILGAAGAVGCSTSDPSTTETAPTSGTGGSGGPTTGGTGPAGGGGSGAISGSSGTSTASGTSGAVSSSGGAGASGGVSGGAGTGGSVDASGGAGVPAGGGGAGGVDAMGGDAGIGGASAGAGGSSGGAGVTSMPCPSDGWSPGDQSITLMHDGVAREYEVHVPPGYTGTTGAPLVLTIHGAHNTIAMVRGWSQMNAVADANGFIVAYPQGLDCWNSGSILPGCSAADDDVGFLTAVVADIENHACIDPKRVYATGISNGAMMAQKLGCDRADVFAAVGGIAGPSGGGCNPSRPISVVYMHGTEDTTVGYSSAPSTAAGWAMRNGCASPPVETYNMGSTRCETYQGCQDSVEVVFCTITGMGHCWPEDTRCGPGGGSAFGVTDFKASPFMWDFFERHPLP